MASLTPYRFSDAKVDLKKVLTGTAVSALVGAGAGIAIGGFSKLHKKDNKDNKSIMKTSEEYAVNFGLENLLHGSTNVTVNLCTGTRCPLNNVISETISSAMFESVKPFHYGKRAPLKAGLVGGALGAAKEVFVGEHVLSPLLPDSVNLKWGTMRKFIDSKVQGTIDKVSNVILK